MSKRYAIIGHVRDDLKVTWGVYARTDYPDAPSTRTLLAALFTIEETQAMVRGLLIGRGEEPEAADARANDLVTDAVNQMNTKRLEMGINQTRRNGDHVAYTNGNGSHRR